MISNYRPRYLLRFQAKISREFKFAPRIELELITQRRVVSRVSKPGFILLLGKEKMCTVIVLRSSVYAFRCVFAVAENVIKKKNRRRHDFIWIIFHSLFVRSKKNFLCWSLFPFCFLSQFFCLLLFSVFLFPYQ